MSGEVLLYVAVVVLGLAFYGLAGGNNRKDDSGATGGNGTGMSSDYRFDGDGDGGGGD